MKLVLRIILSLILIAVLAFAIVYALGSRMPVNHSTTVVGTVEAPPEKVFAIISDVADGPTWRSGLKGVKVLPQVDGKDHWIEDLGHGTTMNFVVVRTQPYAAEEHALRVVRLEDPAYGGDWTYDVSLAPDGKNTILKITEDGYINPPIYRFVMQDVIGMTHNLDVYMKSIQAVAKK